MNEEIGSYDAKTKVAYVQCRSSDMLATLDIKPHFFFYRFDGTNWLHHDPQIPQGRTGEE